MGYKLSFHDIVVSLPQNGRLKDCPCCGIIIAQLVRALCTPALLRSQYQITLKPEKCLNLLLINFSK